MLKLIIIFFVIFSYNYKSFSDEIVQDRNGNYFLMKSDGTFEKLPKPIMKYMYPSFVSLGS